jgi:hypothetical protein
MIDPAKVHEWVALYNWDDGLSPIWAIVENADTDFATALLIYWRLEGPYSAARGSQASDEARRLLDFVRERLLGGVYHKGKLRYDPVADNGLSQTQVYKLKKAGLPGELIQPEYPPEDHTA